MDNQSSLSTTDYFNSVDGAPAINYTSDYWYTFNITPSVSTEDYEFYINGYNSWVNFSSAVEYNFTPLPSDNRADANVSGCPECSSATDLQYNWFFLILLVFVGGGVLGNTLVCLAICLERRLQNVTNYFLLSLAVADLLVSLVVMPFGIVVGFLGYWPFNAIMCNIFVTCDVLACSCSIMHMCFISIGRYFGIRHPLKTRNTSKKSVMAKIVLVWLLSMVITSPITILGTVDHRNIQYQPRNCSINNRFFFIFGSLFAFYIPMVFMVVSYVLTVQLLRQQRKFGDNLPSRRVQLSCRHRAASSTNVTRLVPSESRRSFRATECPTWSNNGHITFHKRTSTCDRGTQTPLSLANDSRRARLRSLRLSLPRSTSHLHFKFLTGRRRSPVMATTMANEQKASKVLGIVFSTFVICWAPFFILNIVFAACPSCTVSGNIVDTCLWLGYVSSTINPIIYTIFNRTFKEAFIKLLLCRCVFRKRYSNARMYRYVDNLVQTPSRSNTCVKSPSFPSFDGQESIC